MITLDFIKDNAKPHPYKGKILVLENDTITFSIVGGATGLYGDFEDNFEVAVIDKKSRQFVTVFYFPEATDDIVPYLEGDKLVEKLNEIFPKDFRVI